MLANGSSTRRSSSCSPSPTTSSTRSRSPPPTRRRAHRSPDPLGAVADELKGKHNRARSHVWWVCAVVSLVQRRRDSRSVLRRRAGLDTDRLSSLRRSGSSSFRCCSLDTAVDVAWNQHSARSRSSYTYRCLPRRRCQRVRDLPFALRCRVAVQIPSQLPAEAPARPSLA
jgi:hypothetical protein